MPAGDGAGEVTVKRASRQALRAECQYCQAQHPRLYRLPLVRPMGEMTDMAVCVFCYIRLAGLKPRPGALVEIASPELA